jgi:hypothetical protein
VRVFGFGSPSGALLFLLSFPFCFILHRFLLLYIFSFLSRPPFPFHPAGEFSDEDGCGGGRGELRLRATYWPLEAMGGHAEARLGALIVTLERGDDLAAADLPVFSSDPYVVFTFGGHKEKPRTSPTVYSTLAPRWADAKFEWFRVSPRETPLKIAVWDYDALSRDELLGEAEVDVYADVACAPGGDVTKTVPLTNVPREWLRAAGPRAKASTVTLRLQWIPFAGV